VAFVSISWIDTSAPPMETGSASRRSGRVHAASKPATTSEHCAPFWLALDDDMQHFQLGEERLDADRAALEVLALHHTVRG
jgi:hypothetical protein